VTEPGEGYRLYRELAGWWPLISPPSEYAGDAAVIEPKSGVVLKTVTPPFKSFLVGKILQGMKTKDEELISSGKLAKGMELRFDVDEANGSIGKIVIENYREKARLNEILSTVSWTFSRMLEK